VSRLSSTTLRIGDPAPLFSLPTLEGSRYQLGDALQTGIGLLVFVPGSWSPGTRRQIGELNELHAAFLEAGIVLILIVTQDASSLRRRLETRPPFPVLIDRDRSVVRDYGVFRAISWDGIGITRPAAFMVDREGAIRFLYVGERDGDVLDAQSLLRLGTWLRGEVPLPAEASEELAAELYGEVSEDGDVSADGGLEETQVVVMVDGAAELNGAVAEPGDAAAVVADGIATADVGAEAAEVDDAAAGRAEAITSDGAAEPGAADAGSTDPDSTSRVQEVAAASAAENGEPVPMAEGGEQAAVDEGAGPVTVAADDGRAPEDAEPAPELPQPRESATNGELERREPAQTRRPTATGTPADH
jgi:peroxiredoxin